MLQNNFPEQNTVLQENSFNRAALASALADALNAEGDFHGYLQIRSADGTLYFLFFLRSSPYAAGYITANKPTSLSITDFLNKIFILPSENSLVSLHQTDPVLLKSMLVFLQEEPTGKVPVNLIDMEQIVRQIHEEEGDALIILEKAGYFNFYFFKNGTAARSYLADSSFTVPSDLSVEEQMLLYAFDTTPPLPTAYIYRNLATEEASDMEEVTREKLMEMLACEGERGEAKPQIRKIAIEIMDQPEKGEQEISLPCTIGRKDCDLLIPDGLVSRKHALLFGDDAGNIFIEDLKSTNGTFVNGKKVDNELLRPLDIVTVGTTRLKVSF